MIVEIDFAHLRISNTDIFFMVITTWKTSSCRGGKDVTIMFCVLARGSPMYLFKIHMLITRSFALLYHIHINIIQMSLKLSAWSGLAYF